MWIIKLKLRIFILFISITYDPLRIAIVSGQYSIPRSDIVGPQLLSMVLKGFSYFKHVKPIFLIEVC